MPEQPNILKFKFDVSAYRLIGRELITDRITALFELVKNSYDANAENVLVQFENINPNTSQSKIIIKDDGLGMSFEDVRDKWMVIGTSSKRKSRLSPEPYNRKVVGKKGIGRFAVDKLGAKLLLKTKQKKSDKTLFLETDWSFYENMETQQLKFDFSGKHKYFTDMENKYWFEDTNNDSSGTTLEISMVNDTWTENDVTRAYKELSKLVSPVHYSEFPFRVKLNAHEYEKYHDKIVTSIAIEHATLKVELSFDEENAAQEILTLTPDGDLTKTSVPTRPCGLVGMTLFYFDQKAKNAYRNAYSDEQIDGIRIYRDGLVTTPFAEYASHQDEQKDLLGIDKRRWSGFFDKISSRDLLGWVDISDKRNPNIIDATNRQDFVDNESWRELKSFIIEQISQIEKSLKRKKDDKLKNHQSSFKDAQMDITDLRRNLTKAKELVGEAPDAAKIIDDLEKQVIKTQVSVKKSYKDYQDLADEKKRQENLFFSIVSLQTYAGMLSHITRTSLGRIKRQAEFIHKWIPDPKFNDFYKEYGHGIFNEMNQLDKAINFLLKYAKDDELVEDVDVKPVIENIFNGIYSSEFFRRGIKTEIIINSDLIITYNRKSFEDIFDNLISNSFKALEKVDGDKKIKISAIVEQDKFIIYFSDNGCGVREEDKTRIFDVFFTRTAEQGGAGLGLFIVKSRIEALNGSIEVADNEFKPFGATFKIELPFKR